MIESFLIGAIEQKTNLGIRIVDDFETCINAIEIEYDNEDNIFTRWSYK